MLKNKFFLLGALALAMPAFAVSYISVTASNKVQGQTIGDPLFFTIVRVSRDTSQCPDPARINAPHEVSYGSKKLKLRATAPKQSTVCLGYLTNDIPSNSVFMNQPVTVHNNDVLRLIVNPNDSSSYCFTVNSQRYCDDRSHRVAKNKNSVGSY